MECEKEKDVSSRKEMYNKGSKREISIRESKVLLFFSFKFKLIIILKKLTNSIEQKERSLNRFELSKISLITVIASILCKTCATPVTLTIPPSRICFTRGENFNLKKNSNSRWTNEVRMLRLMKKKRKKEKKGLFQK